MKTKILIGVLSTALSVNMLNAQNGGTTIVGHEAMYLKKNIVENGVNSKDHTTLVAAVKAAGLVETLMSKGQNTRMKKVSIYRPFQIRVLNPICHF